MLTFKQYIKEAIQPDPFKHSVKKFDSEKEGHTTPIDKLPPHLQQKMKDMMNTPEKPVPTIDQDKEDRVG